MKQMVCVSCLLVAVTVAQAGDKPLPDKLIDVAMEHVRKNGPDSDVAQFVSMSGHAAWLRRNDFVRLVAPFLKDNDPAKVGGAIEVLYRLHCYRPMSYLGDFEKDNAEFLSGLDRLIFAEFEHFNTLTNNGLYHSMALYLGASPSELSSRELRRIIADTSDHEQTLICLAWHRNPKDMEFLFPYMLENTPASRSLPYHFRNSYGALATPYLKRALTEAKATKTRMEAAFELIRLGEVEGFDCLLDLVSENPKTLDKSPTVVENIRQFARDYLAMPTTVSEPKDIASHLERKRAELVQKRGEMEKESNTASHGTALPCRP